MRLLVGLGNPGAPYSLTRHNIGALALARAADKWGIPLNPSGEVRCGCGRLGSVEVAVGASVAWMNRSGPAVKALLDRYGASPQEMVVLHDDLDLELGRIRIKRRGGTGGHNGVLSVLTTLNSDEFYRLKIGIGFPAAGQHPADFVLSPFTNEQVARVDVISDQVALALECLLLEGVDSAMNRFNVREFVG